MRGQTNCFGSGKALAETRSCSVGEIAVLSPKTPRQVLTSLLPPSRFLRYGSKYDASFLQIYIHFRYY